MVAGALRLGARGLLVDEPRSLLLRLTHLRDVLPNGNVPDEAPVRADALLHGERRAEGRAVPPHAVEPARHSSVLPRGFEQALDSPRGCVLRTHESSEALTAHDLRILVPEDSPSALVPGQNGAVEVEGHDGVCRRALEHAVEERGRI